jgi:hypothetical protein
MGYSGAKDSTATGSDLQKMQNAQQKSQYGLISNSSSMPKLSPEHPTSTYTKQTNALNESIDSCKIDDDEYILSKTRPVMKKSL